MIKSPSILQETVGDPSAPLTCLLWVSRQTGRNFVPFLCLQHGMNLRLSRSVNHKNSCCVFFSF